MIVVGMKTPPDLPVLITRRIKLYLNDSPESRHAIKYRLVRPIFLLSLSESKSKPRGKRSWSSI